MHLRTPLFLLICLFGLALQPVYGQRTLPPGLEARLDSLSQSWVGKAAPGFVAGIAWKGEIVYLKSFGSMYPGGPAMPVDAIFRMASMTKPITGLAASKLITEGKLGIDDPVARDIPEFAQLRVIDGRTLPVQDSALRIRHLLTHTSGISYGGFDSLMNTHYQPLGVVDAFTTEPLTLEQNMRNLAKAPLRHAPGEAWTYGMSIDVLGRVVEVVSGESIGDYFYKNFFKPLKLKDTGFRVPEKKISRVVPIATPYQGVWVAIPDTTPQGRMTAYPYRGAGTYEAPGAGLTGTAKDYLTLATMMTGMGSFQGRKVLSPEVIRFAGTNHLPAEGNFGSWKAFGAAMATEAPPQSATDLPGQIDWSGLFNTYFFANPDRDLSVVMLFQLFPGEGDKYYREWVKALDGLQSN